MVDMANLEVRIRAIEDIEAIKKLKAKYWRCLDKKLWDELDNVFAEEAIVDYGPGQQVQGKKAIVQFIKDSLAGESTVTFHGGHTPEIDITSDTTARGIWPLQDYVIINQNITMVGYGHYEDEYVKENGQWRKKSVKLTRILEERSTRKR